MAARGDGRGGENEAFLFVEYFSTHKDLMKLRNLFSESIECSLPKKNYGLGLATKKLIQILCLDLGQKSVDWEG